MTSTKQQQERGSTGDFSRSLLSTSGSIPSASSSTTTRGGMGSGKRKLDTADTPHIGSSRSSAINSGDNNETERSNNSSSNNILETFSTIMESALKKRKFLQALAAEKNANNNNNNNNSPKAASSSSNTNMRSSCYNFLTDCNLPEATGKTRMRFSIINGKVSVKEHGANSSSASASASASTNSSFWKSHSMLLECPVCLEEMADPKLLRCGHNLCAACGEKLLHPNSNSNSGSRLDADGNKARRTSSSSSNSSHATTATTMSLGEVTCPLCEKVTIVGAAGLVSNYGVKELVQRMKELEKVDDASRKAKEAAMLECDSCKGRIFESDMFTCTAPSCIVSKRCTGHQGLNSTAIFSCRWSPLAAEDQEGSSTRSSSTPYLSFYYWEFSKLCAKCACEKHGGHQQIVGLSKLATKQDVYRALTEASAQRNNVTTLLDRGTTACFTPIRRALNSHCDWKFDAPLALEELQTMRENFTLLADMTEKFVKEQHTLLMANVSEFIEKLNNAAWKKQR